MGKIKIQIGCILAVEILILISFSNVVGYQSVKSNVKIDSPLFSIRNNKGDVSSDYLGKEDTIDLLLPKRNSNLELIDKFIDFIKRMDDRTFDIFVKKCIIYINQNNLNKIDASIEEIKYAFYEIRDNPDILKIVVKDDSKESTYQLFCEVTMHFEYIWCQILWKIMVAIITPIVLIVGTIAVVGTILVLILYIPFIVIIILDKLSKMDNVTNLGYPLIS